MEDDWEALAEKETIVIPAKIAANVNKWDGEDEEEDVKDSWEDEEEKKDEEKIEVKQPVKIKPKKSLQAKLNELERLRVEEEERLEQERLENLTPEQRAAEKLRQQQLEKEADLKNALETFGVSEIPTGLDAFHPTNASEFKEFGAALSSKINLYKTLDEFPTFVEELIRSISVNLNATDLKKIKVTVDSLHVEKLKLEKEKSKKPGAKGKSKVKLRIEQENVKSNNLNDYGEGYADDDYDDFM